MLNYFKIVVSVKDNKTTTKLHIALKCTFTVLNEVAKVMFLHLSVSHSVHSRGEYLGRYPPGPGTPPWAGTPPKPGTHPPDQVHPSRTRYTSPGRYTPGPGTPPWTRYTPPGPCTPPGPGTPPGPSTLPRTRYTPRTKYPPADSYCSGRYASYWNSLVEAA